jgi:uncharacterized protein YfcZ (UPF0381/DUF406 family)
MKTADQLEANGNEECCGCALDFGFILKKQATSEENL